MELDTNTAREHLNLADQLLAQDVPDLEQASLRVRMAHECVERVKQETKQLVQEFTATAAECLALQDKPLPVGLDSELVLQSDRKIKCSDLKEFARRVLSECGPETLIDILSATSIKTSSASRACPELYGTYFYNAGTGELKIKKQRKREHVYEA